MADEKKIRVKVQKVEAHRDVIDSIDLRANYVLERTDGKGKPFTVNGRTYKKTFANNPMFQLKKN